VNFRQLKLFREVARRGSFSAAARALRISQPAVSMQVKDLQRQLGVALYRTDGGRTALTEAGRVLADYTERLLQLAEEAEQRLAELRDRESSVLRISTTKTIATYFLPKVMGAFKALHRGVGIRLEMGSNSWATESVVKRLSDIGLVVSTPHTDDLERMTIFEDDLVILVPPAHRLAGTGADGVVLDLSGETLILREEGSRTRQAVDDALRAHAIPVGQTMEVGDVEAIKNAVKAGLGITILPAIAVHDEVIAGSLVALPFLGGRIRLRFEAVYRQDATPPALAFLQALAPAGGKLAHGVPGAKGTT
jgi:molybdate transport repressor ModE-like protein